MRRLLFPPALLVLALGMPLALRAAEPVRSAQEALKNRGFYTGPVDGEPNAELKGAVRRFQMNQELKVTGELDPETLAALNQGEAEASPAPAGPEPLKIEPPAPASPAPAAPVEKSDRDFLRREAAPGGAPAVPPPAPPPSPGTGGSAAFAALYRHTPYENAPGEVQRDTLRKAQARLARRGLYSGEVNGLPGPDTEEALIRFQSSMGFRRMGQLDIDTLAELRLLPVSRVPLKPFRGGPVPKAPPERGAVRGIPLD